ncbi:MAG TPA: hypothetical protein VGC95_01390, partial [Chitinophagaceae bacterium]
AVLQHIIGDPFEFRVIFRDGNRFMQIVRPDVMVPSRSSLSKILPALYRSNRFCCSADCRFAAFTRS